MLQSLPLSLFSSLLLLPLLLLLTSNFAGFDQGQQTWNGEAGLWECTTHSHHRDGQCGSPSKRNIQDALDASNPSNVLEPTEQLGEEWGSRRRRTGRRRRSAADRAKEARAKRARNLRMIKAAEKAQNKKNKASFRTKKPKLEKKVDKHLAAAVPITRFKCSSFSENPDKWIVRLKTKEKKATRSNTARTLLGSDRRRSPPKPARRRPAPLTFLLVLAPSFIRFSRSSSHSSAISFVSLDPPHTAQLFHLSL